MRAPTVDLLNERNERNERWRAFDWRRLEQLPREVVSTLREARRALHAALDEKKLAHALSELVGDRVVLRVARVTVATAQTGALPGYVRFALAAVDESVRVEIDLDPDLTRTAVSRALGRAMALTDPNAAATPELLGAAAAVVAAVARRAHGHAHALLPVGPGGLLWPEGERRLRIDAAVMLGADAYQARATVQVLRAAAAYPPLPGQSLAALGALPITVPVVAAQSLAARGEVSGLAAGDIWLPGAGWSVARRAANDAITGAARSPAPKSTAEGMSGRVVLTPPTSERGIAASLAPTGELVILGLEAMPIDQHPQGPEVNERADTATSEVILDAPLVVRVEMGAVTMSAREWAALVPGDVIALGRRVAEPVALRVAGLEVARGDLVEVEGELGVRIRERLGA